MHEATTDPYIANDAMRLIVERCNAIALLPLRWLRESRDSRYLDRTSNTAITPEHMRFYLHLPISIILVMLS